MSECADNGPALSGPPTLDSQIGDMGPTIGCGVDPSGTTQGHNGNQWLGLQVDTGDLSVLHNGVLLECYGNHSQELLGHKDHQIMLQIQIQPDAVQIVKDAPNIRTVANVPDQCDAKRQKAIKIELK